MTENLVVSNVQRRSKNLHGNSHLGPVEIDIFKQFYENITKCSTISVRFNQNSFVDFFAQYIFDKNGHIRDVIKTATSITISSDQGKGKGFQILNIEISYRSCQS